MNEEFYQSLARKIESSSVLAKLKEMAEDLTGGAFALLLRRDDDAIELGASGGLSSKPRFCQVMDATEQGRKICATCRTLVAFGACYRGATEQACHGGITVFAAPAGNSPTSSLECIVVALRAFADRRRFSGWIKPRSGSDCSLADLKRLRREFDMLPALDDKKRSLAKALVEIAATAVGEIEQSLLLDQKRDQSNSVGVHDDLSMKSIEQVYGAALLLTRDRAFKKPGESRGLLLIDMVKSMVCQNPSLPHTVSAIASVAKITPNHFSMLFHRHTGASFVDFLTEQRMELAKKLLCNLNLSVAEIAYRAGFNDAAYFARRFKKATGKPPGQWRSEANQ